MKYAFGYPYVCETSASRIDKRVKRLMYFTVDFVYFQVHVSETGR